MTVYRPRDLVLARRANRAGAKGSLRIILEARRAHIPISLAFGLVDHESQHWLKGGNIFGCDGGGMFCHELVTKAKVQTMVRHVRAGGTSNGVGFTQLTWLGFILAAERMGGAHLIKNQLRVGFDHLSKCIHTFGIQGGLSVYNSGRPNSNEGRRYAAAVRAKQAHWHRVLDPA